MRNNEEFRQDVYRRFDDYKKKKEEKRRGVLKYGTVAVSALAVVALFIWPGMGMIEDIFVRDMPDVVDTQFTINFEIIDNTETGTPNEGSESTNATFLTTVKATEATTEAYTEATIEKTTEAYIEWTIEKTTEVYTEATIEKTTEAYTEGTIEETTQAYTTAAIAETTVTIEATTQEEGVITFASKYAVAVEGAELVETGFIPKNLNELNSFVDGNAMLCDDVSSYRSGAKSNYVYAFIVRGTAKISYTEIEVGGFIAYRYVIEITDGDEYNMYICFFDTNLTAEIKIVK